MSAYMMYEQDEWDSSWRDAYAQPTRALLEKYGGKAIAVCREGERMEGETKVPTVAILIEFPNRDAAKAWHSDPEYQRLIELRNTGSKAEALLFNGLE